MVLLYYRASATEKEPDSVTLPPSADAHSRERCDLHLLIRALGSRYGNTALVQGWVSMRGRGVELLSPPVVGESSELTCTIIA